MGRKRLNLSAEGARFQQSLIHFFGSVENGMTHFGLAASSGNAYFSGIKTLGLKWKLRLEQEGISFEWIKTGKGSMQYKPPSVAEDTAQYVSSLEKQLQEQKQKTEELEAQNNALRATLAPHLVETILAGVKYKKIKKSK